ncbi:hypothetical protein Tco_0122816 [Tanacetum coccineum]
MLAIFHDMIEESVKVFMDDFSVFGNSFDTCLNNLDKMLQRCEDAHLVLNWEKCHFMVKEGIVLGHKVSSAGLEVDKAKINVISKLLPPTNIKGIRSFLGHASFYQRFIKDFLKIARPLTKLLEKDTPFEFDDECQKAFELLKEKLTCAPVIVKFNLSLPSFFHVISRLAFFHEIMPPKRNYQTNPQPTLGTQELPNYKTISTGRNQKQLLEPNGKEKKGEIASCYTSQADDPLLGGIHEVADLGREDETTFGSRPGYTQGAVRNGSTGLMEQKIQAKNERIAEGLKRKWESNNQGGSNNRNNTKT